MKLTKFRSRIKGEEGSSALIMILLLMPVMLAFFGLGVDTFKGTYIRQETQNNVQTAVISGVSKLNLNQGTIDFDTSRGMAIDQYTMNRKNYGNNIRCATSKDLKNANESLQGDACPWVLVEFSMTPDGKKLTMITREYTPNAWLNMVNIPEYAIQASATASVSYN